MTDKVITIDLSGIVLTAFEHEFQATGGLHGDQVLVVHDKPPAGRPCFHCEAVFQEGDDAARLELAGERFSLVVYYHRDCVGPALEGDQS